jgi:adenylate kinase
VDIILIGPPGAGKGTHAGLIGEMLSIPHISTGDIFRQHIKGKTALGLKVKSFADEGKLVPDEIVLEVIASRLEDKDTRDGVLFDGYPRTIPQAEMLVEWLENHSRKLDGVVCIDVSDAEVSKRLINRRSCSQCSEPYHLIFKPPTVEAHCDKCGGEVVHRADDTPEKVSGRLSSYHEWTAPILDYLHGRTEIVRINGVGSISDISENIKNRISKWKEG